MSLILSIDTSTRGCSVALHQNEVLLGCYELYTDKSSSAMLTTLVKNVVENAGFALKDLDVVAVAKGPGSYTGLRISVATAKGLCFSLDKPLVAVNTLQAMAQQLKGCFDDDYLFCPMIDARRMEVFCAVFDQNLLQIEPTQAKIIDQECFIELLKDYKIIFFGDGAAKCKPILAQQPNAIFLPTFTFPSAKTVGILAGKAFENNELEDLATFEPFYLKDFMTTIPRKKITYSMM